MKNPPKPKARPTRDTGNVPRETGKATRSRPVPRETSEPVVAASSDQNFGGAKAFVAVLSSLMHAAPSPARLVEHCQRHFELMLQWNRTHNLTRITDPTQAASLHYADSLLPLLELPTPHVVADLGSGNGLPGVVAAMLWPSAQVVLVDSVVKKISFLKVVRAELGLQNMQCQHARCEDLAPLQADLLLTRATFPWVRVPGMTATHLAPGGRLFAYIGRDAPDPASWNQTCSASQLVESELRTYTIADHDVSRHIGTALKANQNPV